MFGNRYLEQGVRFPDTIEIDAAIRYYTAAIAQYPQNPDSTSIEPLTYDSLGNAKAAKADYAMALRVEASLIRVQARQYDEVVRLVILDQIGVNTRDQDIYLLHKGFAMGLH